MTQQERDNASEDIAQWLCEMRELIDHTGS